MNKKININTKKLVTVAVIFTMCLLALLNFFFNKTIDSGFSAIVASIASYYFSKEVSKT